MNLFTVQTKAGKVPKELQGEYTKERLAQKAIDVYVAKRDKPKRTYRSTTKSKKERDKDARSKK